MNKKSNFWIGTEVEGRYTNIKTLFVVKDQPVSIIQKHLDDNNIYHIYFGAGYQSTVTNFETLKFFANNSYIVTFEIKHEFLNTIPKYIIQNKNIHIIVTFQSNNFLNLKLTDTLKVEDNNKVFCSTICNTYQTNKETDYIGDKIL